jgi:hypothetical protein
MRDVPSRALEMNLSGGVTAGGMEGGETCDGG